MIWNFIVIPVFVCTPTSMHACNHTNKHGTFYNFQGQSLFFIIQDIPIYKHILRFAHIDILKLLEILMVAVYHSIFDVFIAK